MKKTYCAAVLTAALLTTAVVPAGAVRVSDVAGLGLLAGVTAAAGTVTDSRLQLAPPVQDAQEIGFAGLEKTVRAYNPTVKSLNRTLAGIKNTDLDAQFFNQRLQYDAQLNQYQAQAEIYKRCIDELQSHASDPAIAAQIKVAELNLQMCQGSIMGIQAILNNLDEAQEDAEDDLDDTVATYEHQFENVTRQIIVGAQSAYAGIVQIKEGLATLDRGLATLDRNITVVEKQVEIGMASQITLDNLRQTRRTTAAQRDTLVMQQTATENQLALLLGKTAGMTVKPTTLPEVSDSTLAAIHYEKDLEQAKKNSYSIWSKQDAVRKASNDYEDDVTSTVDAYEAAKIDLEAEKENVANAFRALYNTVQDKKRLLGEAEADYQTQQKNFAVSKVQYGRGMISQLDYLSAQDDLAAKQDAVTTAKHELFTAYNAYDWAKRGYMSSAAG